MTLFIKKVKLLSQRIKVTQNEFSYNKLICSDFLLEEVYNSLKEGIKNKVIDACQNKKEWRQLASDLYWMVHGIKEGDRVIKKLKNKSITGTAIKEDGKMKIRLDAPLKSTNEQIIELRGGYNKIINSDYYIDWQLLARHEILYYKVSMMLLKNEEIAHLSIKDKNVSPIYFVFDINPEACKWCLSRKGEIVRLIHREIVKDELRDKLSNYGITDKYTDTAIWVGKNNLGIKQKRICIPPHIDYKFRCNFDFKPIEPDRQYYDDKRRMVRYRIN